MFTQSEENYLKAIFHLQQEAEKGVSTSKLSALLETKASSITEMVKKLAEKNLVNYQKYYGVELTDTGRKQALIIIRKHRLWECFLVEQLDFKWDEVHEVAEQLEHIKSEKLIDAIDRLLGHPKTDPHGDPIPDKDGNFTKKNTSLLSECRVGSIGIIVGVKDSSPSFLQYLDKQCIALGTKFNLRHKEPFDNALEITVNDQVIKVSHKMASNLYVDIGYTS
ncbi:metal-dependent transcriptional regulator [Aquimarina pacifica]|uniref:metal-dependent transcriptional regulator n=1 Tax=Aquimarina pacifica TaxID=1296415 RepID=UPI000471F688|nr:metal-dependent transcriptional regulator [Aquimarina pacifica]